MDPGKAAKEPSYNSGHIADCCPTAQVFLDFPTCRVETARHCGKAADEVLLLSQHPLLLPSAGLYKAAMKIISSAENSPSIWLAFCLPCPLAHSHFCSTAERKFKSRTAFTLYQGINSDLASKNNQQQPDFSSHDKTR